MEKRGFVSDRCDMNRQIKEDNRLLRELREKVKRLTELVKNTVSFVARSLEALRNKIVGAQYDINYNDSLSAKIQQSSASVDIALWDYGDTENEIKDKTAELNKLKSEQKNLSSVHIFKHKNLTEQIAKTETDLKKLKKHKSELLDRLGCSSEVDIQNVRDRRKNNDKFVEKLSTQNADLLKQKEADISEFLEIRSNTTLENVDAVQEERYNIRDEYMRELSQQIKEKYDGKYSYDILKTAEKSVNDELGEKASSLQRKIRKCKNQTKK